MKNKMVRIFLQGIKRHFVGNYTCAASNEIGEGASSSINLDIKCEWLIKFDPIKIDNISDTPACSEGQQLVYEVAKLSSVHVSCRMDANPDRKIQFNWKFNTTANTVNIPVCLHYFCTLHITPCPRPRILLNKD